MASSILITVVLSGTIIHSQEEDIGRKKLQAQFVRAIAQGHCNKVDRILQQNPQLINTAFPLYRSSPLDLAAQAGKLDVMQILLDNGADIHAIDFFGNTPLHSGAREGKLNVVQFLLENGANIDATNKSCSTPLHWAAEESTLDAVQFLVTHGAEIDAKTDYGASALAIALGQTLISSFDRLTAEELLKRYAAVDNGQKGIENLPQNLLAERKNHLFNILESPAINLPRVLTELIWKCITEL